MNFLDSFHFLRPLWLAALPVAVVLGYWFWKRTKRRNGWAAIIEPRLLAAFMDTGNRSYAKKHLGTFFGILMAWIVGICALAGPTWEKLPTPTSSNNRALIIILDLSLSMLATDIAPSRLERAKFKIKDVLKHRREGYNALVVYAGQAHVVAPLTQDNHTLLNLLTPMTPIIMPALGSRPDLALAIADDLRKQTGLAKAEVLWITDEISLQDRERIEKLHLPFLHLAVIAVGTPEGAPIPLPEQGFLKDHRNRLVLPKLDYDALVAQTSALGAPVAKISWDDQDWQKVLANGNTTTQFSQSMQLSFPQWQDAGPWLVLLLLPIAFLMFRRGWLFSWVFVCLIPNIGWSLDWQALWLNDNQRGVSQMASDPSTAASFFTDPAWQGNAHYRAGNYQEAVNSWSALATPEAYFNLGNAYSQLGQHDLALDAFDHALALRPNWREAQDNRDAVADFVAQQQKNPTSRSKQSTPFNQPEQEASSSQSAESLGEKSTVALSDHTQAKSGQAEKNQSQDHSGSPNGALSDESLNSMASGAITQTPLNQNESRSSGADAKPSLDDPNQMLDVDKVDPEKLDHALGAAGEQKQPGARQSALAEGDAKTRDELASMDPALHGQLSKEEHQSLRQWLDRIPDDSSELLRRKFLYELEQKQLTREERETQLW